VEPFTDNYYTRIHEPVDEVVRGLTNNAYGRVYLGEALPQPYLSFGCDEIAAFCGGTLSFTEDDHETCWSDPFVEDWDEFMPIKLLEDNALWLRMQEFMDKCAAAMEGKMLFSPMDLHTNADLLLALRGAEKLCLDLKDRPGVVDMCMEQTMDVFKEIFERGYKRYNLPGVNGVHLQCDFSCMISTDMFRRFVLPYLEREAEYFNKRVFYHWDGVNALTHTDDLIASKGLYLMAFVPGAGRGGHPDYLELYEKIQKRGKAVSVWGNADEAKFMHKRLKPEKTVYDVHVGSEREGVELLKWFKDNT
jgi:5-methyltetrahydrofolate--homocysteine methyltransferase